MLILKLSQPFLERSGMSDVEKESLHLLGSADAKSVSVWFNRKELLPFQRH